VVTYVGCMVDCTKQLFFFGFEISVVCCLFGFLAGIVVGVCSHFGLGGFGGCIGGLCENFLVR